MKQIRNEADRSPVAVGLGLVPSNGGAYTAVLQFRRALGGYIVSFSDHERSENSEDGVVHLRSGRSVLDRRFLRVPRRELAKVNPIAAQASLLQCHILFRHHAHWVKKVAKKVGVPYWVIPHGCLDPWVYTYRRLRKLLWMNIYGRRILHDAQSVIFATRREMEKANRWMTRDNARVIHWPVEPTHTVRSESARNALRARLGVSPNCRILCMLGRLHPIKRPIESAILFARHASADAHLLLIGPEEGCQGEEVLTAAQAAGMPGRVHWVGPAFGEEKERLLAGCDGYWSYSYHENFNFSAAEAMSAGLPVILSPGNDLVGELHEDDVGWLLTSDDESAVAEALRGWCETTDASLTALGVQARMWTMRELSWAHFASALQALHREAACQSTQ